MRAHGAERLSHVVIVRDQRVNVVFRWCAGCRIWVRVEGIVGRMEWVAQHARHGRAVAQ